MKSVFLMNNPQKRSTIFLICNVTFLKLLIYVHEVLFYVYINISWLLLHAYKGIWP